MGRLYSRMYSASISSSISRNGEDLAELSKRVVGTVGSSIEITTAETSKYTGSSKYMTLPRFGFTEVPPVA